MTNLPDTPSPSTSASGDGPRRWPAGHVIVAVVVALAFASLLNARDLMATAERQPFGWRHDLAVALAKPLVSVADAIGLDEPRNAINTALGRGSLQTSPEPTPPAPTSTPSPSASDPAGTPSPTPTATQRVPISAEAPLRMYIGGDSMIGQFGDALADLADDTGVVEITEIKYEFGSGLSRPDFVDWPARLAGVIRSQDPEVMVLWFGGNDAQPLKLDGVVYEVTQPEWQAEYRSRVAGLMDQLDEAGVSVYWMGMPIPRSAELQVKLAILNDIYSSEAAQRKAVTYVPTWELFAGPDGNFSEYLPNRNGDVVDMRLDDGIHLTTAGAYRAARPTIATIIEAFGIVPAQEPTPQA